MKWNSLRNEPCPVARGLSVVGDRWTMLVLRDCFLGMQRFEQFQASLDIARHVLADRLRRLVAADMLYRAAYQERPIRYEYRLTETGKAFYPVLISLMDWADTHVPIEDRPSMRMISRTTGKPVRPTVIDEITGEPITYDAVRGPDSRGPTPEKE